MRTFIFSNTFLIPSIALIGAQLLPSAARADESSGEDTIIVTATRSGQSLSDSGRSIAVIDITQLQQRQVVGVAELLRTTPGVTLARNGGPGSFTGIFIRGAQSEQTATLIDGVKINDPSSPGGGFNFSDLLTDTIERIEVLRGPQSVLWGSQAIGGVVNLVTRDPSDQLTLQARGEYGSLDTAHLTGHVADRIGPVAFSADVGYLTTDGVSAFDRAFGGREKDGYRLFGANTKAVVTLSDAASIDLRGFYTRSRVDLDGFAPPSFAFGDTAEYQRQEQVVGYGGLNLAMFGGRLHNRVAVNYALVDRDSYDRSAGTAPTFQGRGRNIRYEYQGVADLADWAKATFGGEHQKESYRTYDPFSGTQRAHAHTDSLYADLHLKPLPELSMGGGVRYDDHSGFGHATTTSADISWTPNGGPTRFKASYGEGFKAPTLYQLYSDFGNRNLRAERARGFDAGVVQKLLGGRIELGATWFIRSVRQQIDFDLSSFTYANLTRVRSKGFELEAKIQPIKGLAVTANYTLAHSINREPGSPDRGKDLARRPRRTVNASADYRWPAGQSIGLTVSRVAHSYDDPANTVRLSGYTLVDLRAAWPLTDRVELFGRIENLFAERYETAFRYGQLGRTATIGAKLAY